MDHVFFTMFQMEDWWYILKFVSYTLAFSNSALNPIIYAGFNENFRSGKFKLFILSGFFLSGKVSSPFAFWEMSGFSIELLEKVYIDLNRNSQGN